MGSFLKSLLSRFADAKEQRSAAPDASEPAEREGSGTRRPTAPDASEPTEQEWEQARALLDEAARPACFGKLGGIRPEDPGNRHSSWWGGNFLAHAGEGVPVCEVSGRSMLPIVQVRVDELPVIPALFNDIALLTLWFDPETELIWESCSGQGFTIRTYPSLDGLAPVGPGYKEHPTLPTFPIVWHLLEQDLPDWESISFDIPDAVARHSDSDWFFEHPAQSARSKLQPDMPVKIGGHPQWWQSPQHVEGGEFALFLDSTARGSFGFPAGGSANFFRTADNWEMRVDCT